MRVIALILVFIFASFTLVLAAAKSKVVVITQEQNKKEICVRPGDIIQVELPIPGAAGYAWYVDDLNSEYFEFVLEKTRIKKESGKTGASVTGVWRFKVKKEGKSCIKMDCFRSWEGRERSVDHFWVRVVMKDKINY